MKHKTRLLTAALAIAIGVSGCTPSQGSAPAPRFQIGQFVQFKLDSAVVGMVVGTACWGEYRSMKAGCRYTVRLRSMETRTDSRVLSSDGPLSTSPIATLKNILELELEEQCSTNKTLTSTTDGKTKSPSKRKCLQKDKHGSSQR